MWYRDDVARSIKGTIVVSAEQCRNYVNGCGCIRIETLTFMKCSVYGNSGAAGTMVTAVVDVQLGNDKNGGTVVLMEEMV